MKGYGAIENGNPIASITPARKTPKEESAKAASFISGNTRDGAWKNRPRLKTYDTIPPK